MRTFIILLASALTLYAEAPPERISWDQSAVSLADRRVLVQLTTGERLEGRWAGVTVNAFTIKTRKGMVTCSRTSLLSLRAGSRRVRGRVLGVAAGYAGSLALAALVTRKPDAAQGGWGIAALAAALGGYFAGREFDNATHEVQLVP